ncbi:hypothetical protein FPOA_09344 [Fusarium poae]|uniref:Uncharacterized protein n=1 Tax=Fusarium poae TaxID=36050 RepID=A0A1B8ARM0_FUSPO|nr:hypothetical protein FPOA_09344 [Fusarium poae]
MDIIEWAAMKKLSSLVSFAKCDPLEAGQYWIYYNCYEKKHICVKGLPSGSSVGRTMDTLNILSLVAAKRRRRNRIGSIVDRDEVLEASMKSVLSFDSDD